VRKIKVNQMTQVKWLLEPDAFPDDHTKMTKALEAQGIEYKCLPSATHVEDEFYELFDPNDCVVFSGSLGFGKQFRKNAKWIPGVYYDKNNYKCTNYYPALGKDLVHYNYCMMPFGELIRQQDYLYQNFSRNRDIFVRPNRGDKIFSGKVVNKADFLKDMELFSFYDVDPSELVIVSQPSEIKGEWRFVVVGDKVVAGSQYAAHGCVGCSEEYPQEAFDLAQKIAGIYQPDRVFVVDICKCLAGYKLMEVGCFSCAGLYDCNRHHIVEAVSEEALKEWREYQME